MTAALHVASAWRQYFNGTPCRTFISAMRLGVVVLGSYFYPDVMVTCSTNCLASLLVQSEPKLLVKVPSPSTAAYERRLEFSPLPQLAQFAGIRAD